MVFLDNDMFLSELTRMFHKCKKSGSVSLCMKRYDGVTRHRAKNDPSAPHPEPAEYMCLLRATFGQKKISTVVHAKDVNKFQQAYCNLLRGNMDGLKKIKKTKLKSKATQ